MYTYIKIYQHGLVSDLVALTRTLRATLKTRLSGRQVTQHVTEASSRRESKVCHEFFASACAWGREAAGWSWRCCVNVIVINLCFTCNAGHDRIPERSQFRRLHRLCL